MAPLHKQAGPRVGVALGGGGVRGLAHVLVFEALDELGCRPTVLAGTSMGAVIRLRSPVLPQQSLTRSVTCRIWVRMRLLPACVLVCALSGLHLAHGATGQATSATAASSATASYDLPGDQVDVFSRGRGPCHTYRIPALVKTSSGTLLAFCEGRRNSAADHGDVDILVKRSRDGGRTWGEFSVVHHEDGGITIGNPVPVFDRDTGQVWLAFCRNNRRVFVTSSADEGGTWTLPREITQSVKPAHWGGWYATGPGHGIQLRSGRLTVPANHGETELQPKGSTAIHVVYSDDHGDTWKVGKASEAGANEVTMAERSDGTVYMNARNNRDTSGTANYRAWTVSHDGGISWGPVAHDPVLVDPVCQGSVLASRDSAGHLVFLFSNPASLRRQRMTVRLSMDEGRTWPKSMLLYEGPAAYSDLVELGDGWYGCLYERDGYRHLTFARFPLDWIGGR